MIKEYRNLFKGKTSDELIVLYEQFLEFERTGFIPEKTELAGIRDEYCKWFGSSPLAMVQFDLLHTISDMWYGENQNQK